MALNFLIVGLSGFLGSITRYAAYLWLPPGQLGELPKATLLVNAVGCLLIGIVGGLVERDVHFQRPLHLAGAVGFLGAFTTFSAFGFETIELIRAQQLGLAALNVTANVLLGLLFAWLGRLLALAAS